MNVHDHFVSITQELNALKDRVRNFIAHNHKLTDGEWKESVLRTVLRRHIPATYTIGRGFVVTDERCSNQIDILIYDSAKPVLYKDGDLVFVTADAVRAIIEVKSRLDMHRYKQAIAQLVEAAEFIRAHRRGHALKRSLFVGLFAYDTSLTSARTREILAVLQHAADGKDYRVVNHVCLGTSIFIRFWGRAPGHAGRVKHYNRWHLYDIENLSVGYFVNNVVERLSDSSFHRNRSVWFPQSKATRRIDAAPLDVVPTDTGAADTGAIDTEPVDTIPFEPAAPHDHDGPDA